MYVMYLWSHHLLDRDYPHPRSPLCKRAEDKRAEGYPSVLHHCVDHENLFGHLVCDTPVTAVSLSQRRFVEPVCPADCPAQRVRAHAALHHPPGYTGGGIATRPPLARRPVHFAH